MSNDTRAIGKPLVGAAQTFEGSARPRTPVFVQANAPLFYCVGIAALTELEGVAVAERLARRFADYRDVAEWLRHRLMRVRQAHADLLATYIASVWPTFDFVDAYRRFVDARASSTIFLPGAVEALQLCVRHAESALLYRCLSKWAEHDELRALAARLSVDESDAFDRFVTLYRSEARRAPLSAIRSWKASAGAMMQDRDLRIPTAFHALVEQWGPNNPFMPLTCGDFMERMRVAIHSYAHLTALERLVFRPWLKAGRQ